jgi:preprotein translocase subunit SecD
LREAHDLALVLRSGSLPAPLRHLSTTQLSGP